MRNEFDTLITALNAHLKAMEAIDQVSQGYTSVGSYPLFALTVDGSCLCPSCVREEKDLILGAHENHDKQWQIDAVDVNWESEDLICDNCYELIECAYPSETENQESEQT